MLIKRFSTLGLLCSVLWWGASLAQTPPQSPRETVITVPSVPVGGTVTLGGTVVPYKEATLSAQLPGRVESIAGEEGDSFAAGTVLVTITDADLLAQRRAAFANLANAEASLRNAGVQYSRQWVSPYGGQEDEYFGGMGSLMRNFTNPMNSFFGSGHPRYERGADLYSYSVRVEQARNQLVSARAKIEEIDTKLRDTKSVAPFDGVITKKLVEVGDPVQPGMPMLLFADTSQLQIQVEIPARLMPGVKKGMVVPARLDVGNVSLQARVQQIFPMADPDRHTVTVKFDLPQGAPAGAGMYAEVIINDISAKVHELPVVPKNALVWRGSLPGLYVLTPDNRRELRLVRTGDEVGVDGIAILAGVKPGERVIVPGVPGGGGSQQ
jgi:multidrug efflux pump subunit AcrA (membrane-fusion protein)